MKRPQSGIRVNKRIQGAPNGTSNHQTQKNNQNQKQDTNQSQQEESASSHGQYENQAASSQQRYSSFHQQQQQQQQLNQSMSSQYSGRGGVNNVRKHVLMSRLYDTGVSNMPLPSVERPLEKKASTRPFSAKMGKKSNVQNSQVKKRLQDLSNKFTINETYLTNHPGNLANYVSGCQNQGEAAQMSFSQLDLSSDPVNQTRVSTATLNKKGGYHHPGRDLVPSISDVQLHGPAINAGTSNQRPLTGIPPSSKAQILQGRQKQTSAVNYTSQRGKSAMGGQSSSYRTGMPQHQTNTQMSRPVNATNYSHVEHSITGISTMTALKPQRHQMKRTKTKDFISAKISAGRPKSNYGPVQQRKQETQSKLKQVMELQQMEYQVQQSENMQRDPTLIQFSDLSTFQQKKFERARSKYLVDKLTNKLGNADYFLQLSKSMAEISDVNVEIDERQFKDLVHRGFQIDPQQVLSIPEENAVNVLSAAYNSQMEAFEKDAKDQQTAQESEVRGDMDALNQPKQWSELDKMIELLLDSKQTDQSVFMYLIPKANGNPYDLEVCQYQQIEKTETSQISGKDAGKYYTLSSKGITLYVNQTPVEFISLGDWLIERDSYYHIKKKSFFRDFKQWKFLRMWRKNITQYKRAKARRNLEEKLFMLDDIFRPRLIKHRHLSLDMAELRFITKAAIDTQTIDEFKSRQAKQRKTVSDKIKEYSAKCRVNVKEAIDTMLSDLRKRVTEELAIDDSQKQNNPSFAMSQAKKATVSLKDNTMGSNSVFEKLGFPDHMSYGHRANLRKECSRFLRFAYLIDFIALNSLTYIYVFSIDELIQQLEFLDKTDNSHLTNQDGGNNFQNKGIEPMFSVDVHFYPNNVIPEDEIIQSRPEDFLRPPHGESQDADFDPNVHLELEPEPDPDASEHSDQGYQSEAESFDSQGNIKLKDPYAWKLSVPTLWKRWLKIEPSAPDMIYMFNEVIKQGLESIKVFERWSKHDDLTPYANALEEWDDMVGDDWEAPEKNSLDPYTWIKEHPIYDMQTVTITNILTSAESKALDFLEGLQPYLETYWNNNRIDFLILINERLKSPTDSLVNTNKLFNLQKNDFDLIPAVAIRGLLMIKNEDTKEKLTPQPKECLKRIEEILPDAIRSRTDIQRQWLKQALFDLNKRTQNVEEFVDQTNSLNRVNDQFLDVRDKVQLYGLYYNIFSDQQIACKKEDRDNHTEAVQEIQKLQSLMTNVESSQNTNLDRFRKTLSKQIPDLLDKITDCTTDITDSMFLEESPMQEVLYKLQTIDDNFQQLEKTADQYNQWQSTLQVPQTRFDSLDELRDQVNLRCLMWRSLNEWQTKTEDWYKAEFNEIDVEQISNLAERYSKTSSRVEKNLPINPISQKLKQMVDTIKDAMPVVKALRNDNLEQEHWDQIKKLVGQDFDIQEEGFTLHKLTKLNLQEFQEEIQAISMQATGESELQKKLTALEETWKAESFKTKQHKENVKDSFILEDVDDISNLVDESLANVNMILGSRFVKPLRTVADKWKKDLVLLFKVLEAWIQFQKQWMYLENIFQGGTDIRKNLSNESNSFDKVDKSFKKLMSKIVRTPKVHIYMKATTNPTMQMIYDQLTKDYDDLEIIQKRLDVYLEQKRKLFPRFYFLSNEDLLEILAKSSENIEVVQQNLRTCFDNIVRLDIDDKGEVTQMRSAEGEEVPLQGRIKTRGQGAAVEQWLDQVADSMTTTVTKEIKKGLGDVMTLDRKQWVLKHYGQVVSTVSQINWCSQTETSITMMEDNPFSLQDSYEANIIGLDQLIDLVNSELHPIKRKIIVALVTTDVHARDIVDNLIKENVQSPVEFEWQKQLRYYAYEEENDSVTIRQVNASFKYGNEYMGATSRLVITPLTDRCWITITGALNLKLGASPAGPAGTGKTESTKDLAKGLGMQCVVFNCSEQITYKMMGRIFSGLAQTGAWTCLDEFNRIDIEVLSVIAQQLLTIRQALLANKTDFEFEDSSMPLVPTLGVFITMNPGYAGRTELPDNLKVLFRPVSMMIPEYRLIAQIMLFAEGFKNGKELSLKMAKLYKLSSEQLSQQKHYDFGLRAVKSVLVMAGALKRANQGMDEDIVLIRAMRDSNIPKFLKDDLPLFSALIQDLFPTAQIPNVSFEVLESQIKRTLSTRGLQPIPAFVTKVVQLFDTFDVRFGVMIVGATGSGKTTCYKVLQDAMTSLKTEQKSNDQRYQIVKDKVLNPKSITMGELYGEVNPMTEDWHDGLASKIMREAALEQGDEKTWVVFDGPVDALWIENMNTVLDDNMTLCLANGQRIKLRHEMRMLFEVQDLIVASPATVSRCGMVYMTPEDMGWQPYVHSWIPRTFEDDSILNSEHKKELLDLFETSIDVGLEKIRNHDLVEYIKTVDVQRVTNICNILEIILKDPKFGFKGKPEELTKMIPYYFVYAFVWGMGASLDAFGQDKFDEVIRDLFKFFTMTPASNCFDYYLQSGKELRFVPWSNKVQDFIYDKEKSFFELLVPTVDTYRSAFWLEHLLCNGKQILFTGDSGVGKSVIILNTLAQLQQQTTRDMGVQPIFLNFSAQTSSIRTQKSIEQNLDRKGKGVFTGPPGKRLTIFIDDVNMPETEFYGAQPPIELLRLFVDRSGLYDRETLEWKQVVNTTTILACAPPSGGRNEMSPRLTRHFNILCIPEASNTTLQKIFGSILEGFLSHGFSDQIKKFSENAISATIDVYNRIVTEKRPTPAKFHYLFSLRDVSKVCQGLLMVKPVSCGSADIFAKLWMHECCRVFHDRLINDDDKLWFTTYLVDNCNSYFKTRFDHEDLFVKGHLIFGDLLKLDSSQNYEEIRDIGRLKKVLVDYLDDYNVGSNHMSLVFFQDAIEHITRISRVLRQPRGNMMNIGVGGSGKQSLIRMSCHMLGFAFRQVEITKRFGPTEFRDSLKELMFLAGCEGQNISFVLTDTQITHQSFLEDINNLLNTGDIPNLFAQEDYEKIQNDMHDYMQKNKLVQNTENILLHFNLRVRNHLHICLCMSPIGPELRVNCRQFPSLVNCCTLNWFDKWPESALLYVSSEFLKEVDLPSDKVRFELSQLCMHIHMSVGQNSDEFFEKLRRKVYTTPKSYLDLIKLYKSALEQKREEAMINKRRLAIGLKKLEDTNSNIAEFKIKITELQPQLKEKNEKIIESLVIVDAETKQANEKERVVSEQEYNLQGIMEETEKIANEAASELAKATPLVEKAVAQVNKLDKNSIVELKSYQKPKESVQIVMEAVMIILGEPKDWANARKVMNEVNVFQQRLKNLRVEDCTDKMFNTIRNKYINKESFKYENVVRQSPAAATLSEWLKAFDEYAKIMKIVTPIQERYNKEKAALDKSTAELNEKKAEVQKLRDKVKELTDMCKAMEDEKAEISANMQQCTERLERAEKLLILLKDEGVRWKETVEVMDVEIEKLVGNVFLSCGCISYYGAFTGLYREQMVQDWLAKCIEKGIPISENFNIIKIMGNPVTIRNWNQKGLPSDTVSTENGILATIGDRYPLMIDPQQQANKWIKQLKKDCDITIMKQSDKDLHRKLGTATTSGKPVLIEDVEEFIDPSLDCILLKQQYKQEGGLWQIKIGDQVYDYENNFQFFMTTKMPNPFYKPEIFIKMTIVNFTVTFQGLEDQLLGEVVIQEKPHVEKQRDEIVVSMARDKDTLVSLEEKILKLLAESSEEQILDEDDLILFLEDSKKTSADISTRLEDAEVVELQINETRNQYRSVAIRGSILYFVISDLSLIDSMYQYSLSYVKKLFIQAIEKSPEQVTLEERLNVLENQITETLFQSVSQGLFVAHKSIFSFLIATSINRNSGKIKESHWGMLLRGAGIFNEDNQPKNPKPSLISKLAWDLAYYLELEEHEIFGDFTKEIIQNFTAWEKILDAEEPQNEKLPEPYDELDQFKKMLIIKIFRPEKLLFTFTDYVKNEIGQDYIENRVITMQDLYDNSTNKSPVIFILSTGADPTTQLFNLAEELGMDDEMTSISLGQGQGVKATTTIKESIEKGEWVVLQNCHLSKRYMPELEQIIYDYQQEDFEVHEEFRLFLTSMPCDYFPVSVLQNGIKLTTEPPKGLKANLMKSFNEISEKQYNESRKPQEWQKLMFGLCFFHAVIQERKKFGPLGWNKVYEFNDSDRETSLKNLHLFLEENEEVPWEALNYVTGQINYGGRVTDDLDRRCLLANLSRYYNSEILEDDYKFSSSGIYYAPENGDLQRIKDYIQSLPINDLPETFGMHNNANITYQTQESEKMIMTVLSIQPRVQKSEGGKSQDELVMEQSEQLLGILPELLTKEGCKKGLFKANEAGLLESLSTVLLQEIEKFNKLLTVIQNTLKELQKAIQGLAVMSREIDQMYLKMSNGIVPDNWSSVAYPSLKPLSSWFKDLIQRVKFLAQWLKNGNPISFWISGFFFPQGFMTGVLQTYARKHMAPIDELDFGFTVVDMEPEEITEHPEDGVFIHGLYMEGARWDINEGVIEDSLPAEMYYKMPVIWFQPIQGYQSSPDDYQCPIYKTSERAGVLSTTGQSTNFVLAVDLPTREMPSYWILKGTAMLCQLND